MAKNINTGFIVGLAIGVTALAGGVGYVGWRAITKSGQDYIRLGDEAMQAGDFEQASLMYSRAVNHEQTRLDWREKWNEAMLKTTPDSMTDYIDRYQAYQQSLESLAAIDIQNPQRYVDALSELLRQQEALGGTDGWQQLFFRADTAIEQNLGGVDDPRARGLRRFRGLAGLELIVAIERSQDQRDEVLADLQAAYEFDPADTAAGLAIARYHLVEYSRHARDRREQLAERAWTQAAEQFHRLIEAHGQDPRIHLAHLQAKFRRAGTQSTNLVQIQAAVDALEGEEEPLADLLQSLPPEQVPSDVIDQFVVLNNRLNRGEGAGLNQRILERALQARPDDHRLLLVKGVMLAGRGELDEAYATFKKVADAPWPQLSLEGMLLIERRPRALLYMGETSLAKWETLPEGPDKEAAWQRAQDARERLVSLMPGGATSLPVLQLDGKIAYAEGHYAVAAQKFSEIDRIADSADPEILRILVEALIRQDQLGAAREKLDRLITLQPGNVAAMMRASQIDMQLQNHGSAETLLQRVLALNPTNETARQRLATLRAVTLGVQTDDPVVNAIVEARRMWRQPDVANEEVVARIDRLAQEHPDDIRPIIALIQLAAEIGDTAGVERYVTLGIERFPDDSRLQLIQERLNSQDPLEFSLSQIEQSPAPPAAKAVRKHFLYAQFGKEGEAETALARAIELDPDEPSVIEAQFIDALRANDISRARSIAARAAELNTDSVGGLLYEARTELSAGRFDVAVGLLERAVDLAPLTAATHRYLGEALFRVGRVGDAIQAFARAAELRPNDTTTIRAFVQALIRVGRLRQALDVARRTVQLTRLDSRLNEQWLLLEEMAGDNSVALREREGILQRRPGDRENLIALIRLYLTEERWDDARRLIALASSAGERTLPLVALEARLQGLQGDVDAGRAVFRQHIASIPQAERTPIPHMALAEYLLEFDDEDAALATLDEARPHQSAERMEVDRRLGDFYFDRGRLEAALAPYKRVIDGGADSERHEVAMRYAETLLRLQRWDDADAVLASLDQDGPDGFRIVLLRADAARGKGDVGRARQMLDAAVQAAPTNPIPFIRRAGFNASDPTQFNDVMQDLEQALALDPASVPARQIRAALLLQRGRVQDAVTEYAAGVEANPNSEELRLALIRQYQSVGRQLDAEAAALGAIAHDPQNPRWRMIAGDVFAEGDKWERAVEHFRAAYNLDASLDVAARLAEALLSLDPPGAGEALSLLEEQGEAATESGRLLALRAWALAELERSDEAAILAVEALAHARTSADLRVWFRRLPNIMAGQDVVSFVDEQTPPDAVAPLYTALRARLLLGDASRRPQLLEALEHASQRAEDPFAITEISRSLGMLHYIEGRYAPAAEAFARGAATTSNDFELNNNLAYIRARYLDDVEGALGPAERAVELSPTNASVLDTLGWVYHRLGRHQQARSVLTRALDRASSEAERAPVLIHLAQTLLEVGEVANARRRADQAAELLRGSQSLTEEYEKELQALMDRLNQVENTQ